MKTLLKWLLKIGLIALAFYLVFKKVSWESIKDTLQQFSLWWLIPAFILYNLSQFLSAYRLLHMFRSVGVNIPYVRNLQLYYKSMFYGLFLPGGVSGDAYKVIYLQKRSEASYKTLITATLLDRVNGLTTLLSIAALLLIQRLDVLQEYVPVKAWWIIILLIIGWLVYFLLHRKLFPAFNGVLFKITTFSWVIQCLQLLSFFCLLKGFAIVAEQWISYGILFYGGSVMSALPLSINGLGIREWVLVTGSGLMMIDSAKAFSASFLFTLISGVCALIGGIVPLVENEQQPRR